MANIRITNQTWDGDLLLSCNMDGVPVMLIDKSWSAQDVLDMVRRGGAGGVILAAFFPAGFALGAIIGALSKLVSMETGYYNENKRLVYSGKLYRDDLF